MEFVLGSRQYALNGILNGIDYAAWSPERDGHLPQNYSRENLAGKAECKAALQHELGLPVQRDVPLLAFIGRLDGQKGADLILQSAPWIMQQVRVHRAAVGGCQGMLLCWQGSWQQEAHESAHPALAWRRLCTDQTSCLVFGAASLLRKMKRADALC